MRLHDGDVLRTVGELKKALADIPDDTALALCDVAPEFGLAKPYLSMHSWMTYDNSGYYRKGESKHPSNFKELPRPVCVIEAAI